MYYSKNLSKNNSSSRYHLNNIFLIEEIKNDEMNNECFDCGASYPQYISINNGIFLCKKCIYYHYKFPDDISTLIQNNLYALGKRELKFLYYGGNRKLTEYLYLNCPKLNKYQPELLYKTEEMYFYRYKLEKVVNEKESKEDKLFLTQKEFYHPMTEKRENYKYNNNNLKTKKYTNRDLKINTDNMSYIKNKYNYRKIPTNKNHEFYNNYNYNNNNQKTYRSEASRKEYKKRLIPSYTSNTYKVSSDSYKDLNSKTYRQNRFFINTNYFSNDSYLSRKKTFEQNNDIYNNKYEFDNNGSNSWFNTSSNIEEKKMNSSYQGQNINYKNYINNTININSPKNNNFYYDFNPNNNMISKSPDVNNMNTNFKYFSNNKPTKCQSFYKNLSIQIPNKINLPNSQSSRSFISSSSRVYSKPKLPKCKINKRKNIEKQENLGNYNLVLKNDKNNEKIKNKSFRGNSSPRIPKINNDFILDLNNNNEKNKSVNHESCPEDNHIINKNNDEKIISNNINANQNNNEKKENSEEGKIKIISENLIDVKIEGESNEITNDKKNREINNENIKEETDKNNNIKDTIQPQINKPIIVKRKDIDLNVNNNNIKKEIEDDINRNKEKVENKNHKINEDKTTKDNLKSNNQENKKKLRRNKKRIKIEEDERKKMEKEEKIKREELEKLKTKEEERKKILKKKFTKKEKIKMIQEERIMMEKEEIKAKRKKKEIEDKIIKEEDEEDELEEEEKFPNQKEEEKEEELIKEEENKKDKEEEIANKELTKSSNKNEINENSDLNKEFDGKNEGKNIVEKNYFNEEKEKNYKEQLDVKENKINSIHIKLDIDDTFKNSIRNKYKRKRNQLLNL